MLCSLSESAEVQHALHLIEQVDHAIFHPISLSLSLIYKPLRYLGQGSEVFEICKQIAKMWSPFWNGQTTTVILETPIWSDTKVICGWSKQHADHSSDRHIDIEFFLAESACNFPTGIGWLAVANYQCLWAATISVKSHIWIHIWILDWIDAFLVKLSYLLLQALKA